MHNKHTKAKRTETKHQPAKWDTDTTTMAASYAWSAPEREGGVRAPNSPAVGSRTGENSRIQERESTGDDRIQYQFTESKSYMTSEKVPWPISDNFVSFNKTLLRCD